MKNGIGNNVISRSFFKMSIPAKFQNRPILFFVVLMFLIGLALLPVLAFILSDSVIIARTPITFATSPSKAGDATTFMAIGPPSLFTNNTIGNVYRQIGSNSPQKTETFSTFDLRDNGSCNATTGRCMIRGNWNESQLACPAGVTGVQQMTEWYVVGGFTSNKLTWYFQCSNKIIDQPPIDSVIIARTPITFATSPYKTGDANTFTAVGPLSLFTNNTIGNVYRQIGSNPPQKTETFSTFDLRDNGSCNATTGKCIFSGNWNESQLACPAGVKGVQQMTEWAVVGGFTSNKLTWYFQCSGKILVTIGSPSAVLPLGYTAVYKVNNDIWIASRITRDAIVFMRWGYPLSSTNVVWRSSNKNGKIKNETSSEIFYENISFYEKGAPADTFGSKDPLGPYKIKLTTTGITIFNLNSVKITDGSRIGYGPFPMYHTLQWCGLNTICNKVVKEDLWEGWPLFVFALQQQNSDQAVAIMFSPFGNFIGGAPGTGNGFEITQGSITGDANNGKFIGRQGESCLQWTKTLGLCSSDNTIYAPAGDVYIKMKENSAQWWLDLNYNGIADCTEFGPSGTKYPDQVLPHGIAAGTINRNIPTRSKSTWRASKEGSCAR